jgi:hypothetical protein
MAQQNLDFGTAANNDGESMLSAFTKIEANFTDLYGIVSGDSSPLLMPDGTITAPGLAFDDDTDVGFYRPAADTLGISVGGNNTGLQLTATSMLPTLSDGVSIGSATKMFSDIFLADGAVVNFNNGDATITHSANALAFAGATSGYAFSDGIITASVSGSASRFINTNDAASVRALRIEGDRATPTDNDNVHTAWMLSDDGGTQVEVGRITVVASDVSAGSVDGQVALSNMEAGALASNFFVGYAGASATKLFAGGVNAATIGSNWAETLRPFSTSIAQVGVISTIGQIGVMAASRTSDYDVADSQGTIGFEAVVNNDNTNEIMAAFGAYFEAYRQPTAGSTLGLEIDIINLGTTVTMSPSNTLVEGGFTPCLWLASGGGVGGVTDATMAIGLWHNGAKFEKGLFFGYNSLTTRADGLHEAISLGTSDALSWHDTAGGGVHANIYSDATDPSLNLRFENNKATFETIALVDVLSITQNSASPPTATAGTDIGWNLSVGDGESVITACYVNSFIPSYVFRFREKTAVSTARDVFTVKRDLSVQFGETGWLDVLTTGFEDVAIVNGLSSTDRPGGVQGAGRASDAAVNQTQSTIGVTGVGVNDRTFIDITDHFYAFGGYFEGRRLVGGGTTQGVEIGVADLNSSPIAEADPYLYGELGQVNCLWLSAGRPDLGASQYNPSIAIGMIQNGPGGTPIRFDRGIVFGDDSIQKYSTVAQAILMPHHYEISWWGGIASRKGYFRSDSTSSDDSAGIILYDGATIFESSGSTVATISSTGIAASIAGNAGQFVNTTDATPVQVARFEGDRATPADGDNAYISYMLSNDLGTQTEFGRFFWTAADVNNGTGEDGGYTWSLAVGGVMTNLLGLSATGLALRPSANDGIALGTSAISWSDLFLASGGVINWNAGAYTLTQSSSTLTASGTIAASSLTVGAAPVGALSVHLSAVDFNVTNTDYPVTIVLPTGYTRYRMLSINISGASGSISAATVGAFTAAAGGGTTMAADQAVTITTASENTANNCMALVTTGTNTQSYNDLAVFFRIGTTAGAARTANVTFTYVPLP